MEPTAARGQTYLDYTNTSFLNGFYSDTAIWTKPYSVLGNQTSPEYLNRTYYLKSIRYFDVNRFKTWAQQVQDVAPKIGASERHVLVAHSLGSLVARGVYIDSARTRSSITGILAMAAPHQGTILADSADKARNFLLDVQRRVNAGIDALSTFLDLASIIGTAVTSPYAGPVFAALAVWGTNFLDNQKLDLTQIAGLTRVAALGDVKTQSPTIQYLNSTSNTPDASIQRFNLVGAIPLHNAAIRIKNSLANGTDADFDKTVKMRNYAVDAFHACRVIGYGAIATAGLARKCGFALRVLGRVDDRWGRYVNGSEVVANVPIFGEITRARQVPFDGIVSNERSRYPGLTDPARHATANFANHQNIYSDPRGLDLASQGMGLMGMVPTNASPAFTIGISGPSSVPVDEGGTWTATVSGGTAPFRYQWSGMLSGTSSTISGPGGGNLTLDMWDQFGGHRTVTKSITTTTTYSCGTRKVC